MSRILLASSVSRTLNPLLQARCLELLHRVIATDLCHEFGMWVDFRTRAHDPDEDYCQRICAVGDAAASAIRLLDWDYVWWTDGDVVDYPGDVCSRLLEVNDGITAPLPLVEGSRRLYDTFGCVDLDGRHLAHDEPYWRSEPTTRFVPMQEVGMALLMPAWLLAKAGIPYTRGRSGWWAACEMARQHGLRVGFDRETVAAHAELPRFGIPWH